jgi:hypothetical protein
MTPVHWNVWGYLCVSIFYGVYEGLLGLLTEAQTGVVPAFVIWGSTLFFPIIPFLSPAPLPSPPIPSLLSLPIPSQLTRLSGVAYEDDAECVDVSVAYVSVPDKS